ncbi:MAG TPA: YhcH/YjgK/YiaL family protein [Longimicrobium sp.]|uniref:YhcH/YjgK/YiaL family protein n=1 Tax=Longimicrobium sp. TaxID=2029185 RepID=UPI002ED9563F
MILTTLAESAAYEVLGSRVATGLRWLREMDPANGDGRHAIDGEEVFALVSSYQTGPATEKRFESHRVYVDLQYVVSGSERILHAPVDALAVETPYDPAADIAFYAEPLFASSLLMRPGDLAVFHPGDGHKPGCMAGGRHEVKKVVVKVRL